MKVEEVENCMILVAVLALMQIGVTIILRNGEYWYDREL